MKKFTFVLVSLAASMSLTAGATLPADHLATLRKDVKKVAKSKKARKSVAAKSLTATPRMVAKDDLQGDAQPMEDQLEIEALSDNEDANVGEASNGTLAMQNGIRANNEINSVQTILKGWQPISTPSLPTVTTSQKK